MMVEANQKHSEKSYWKKPENYISLATLFAVLIYTGVQIAQTWFISSNNVVSQRAFVYFAPSTQPFVSGEPTDPKALNFPATLNNSGNTPTKNLTFFYKCAPSAEELTEPWTILYQGKDKPDSTPNFIGGHASITLGCSFSWAQMEQIAAGKQVGYLMAEAIYWDRLDDKIKHITQATWKLAQVSVQAAKMRTLPLPADASPSTPSTQINISPLIVQLVLSNAGKHNCADEECPAQ